MKIHPNFFAADTLSSPRKGPSRLKRVIAGLLVAVQVASPMAASAAQYIQLAPVPGLQVLNGSVLPVTNVDTSNATNQAVVAGGAVIKASPSSIDFGTTPAGMATPVQTITLTNLGGDVGTLGTLSVNNQFTLTNNCDGVVLPSLGTCQVNVSFAPTQVATGGLLGTLTVPISAGASKANLFVGMVGIATEPSAGNIPSAKLEGFGASDPSLAVSAADGSAQVLFSDVIFNGTAQSKVFVLRSTGTTALNFNGLSFKGNDGSFTSGSNCPVSLSPGSSCVVTVNFAPHNVGVKTAELEVNTNAIAGNAIPVRLSGTALSSTTFSASATSVNFGNVAVGQTTTKDVLLTNTGNMPLTAPAVSTYGSFISASHNCPVSLDIGGTCVVTLSFTPAAVAAASGNVSIRFAGSAVTTIALAGQGSGPILTVDSTSQNFGNLVTGQSATRTFTVTNEGNVTAPLAFGSIAAPVTRAGDCTSYLAAGNVCHVVLTYAPTIQESLNGAFTLSSTLNSVVLSYSGSATWKPGFALSASAVDFGATPVGTQSTKSVLLTNSSNATLGTPTITSDSANFTISTNCAVGLTPGQSCAINVSSTPASRAVYSGNVTVVVVGATPLTISLSAAGQSAVLSVDQSVKYFGSVDIGTTGTLSYVMSNLGDIAAPLTFGQLAANVVQTGTCNSSLTAGASCSVTLSWSPVDTTLLAGSLSVTTANSSLNLAYSGTPMTVAKFALTTSSVAFGALAANGTYTQSFSVLNTGSMALTAANVAVTGGGFSALHNCPASLPVGGSCDVTVTFSPMTAASYAGTVLVTFAGAEVQAAVLNAQSVNATGTGQTALLNASALSQSFGNVNIGDSATLSYTITNSGNISATLGYSAVSAPVTQSGTCAATLAAGTSCTVVLTYAPTSAITTNGALTVSATNTAVTLSYSGTGVALPSFSLSSTNVTFGNVAANATATQTIQISNTGNVVLAAPVVGYSGAGVTESNTCAAALPVGAYCVVNLTFTPTAAQLYGGTLSVAVSGLSTQTVSVTGTGQSAVLAVDATSQAFGTVSIGSNMAKTFTITNTGNIPATLAIDAVSAPVVKSGTCSETLAAGVSCNVVLTFSPVDTIPVAGTVTVQAANTAVALSYSGVGAAYPGFTLSGTNLNFGNLAANATAQQTIRVYNAGNVPLATPSISESGAGFGVSHNCGASLAVGASCLVTTTFSPTAAQSYAGSLSVSWAGVVAQTATFSGTGQTAILAADVTTQAFGSVNILSSSSKTFTLTNNGNIAATLAYTAVSAPVTQGGTCTATLAAGASCTLVLTYAPTTTAVTNGSLTASATNTSVTLNYSGTGVALPGFSVSSAAVAFGNVAANATATQTVQVTNTGNVLVAAPVVSFAGTGVTQSNTCAGALAVGSSCTVTLTFAPTTALLYGGTLSVAANGLSTQTVPVTGTGQCAVLSVDSASQAFGTVSIGSSMSKTFTLTNNGNIPAALTIDAVSAPVVKTGTCSITLAAGASCIVILTYSPVDTSSVSSTVNVHATNTALALSYSGVGAAYPGFTLSGTSLNFGNLAANGTAQQTITVYNAGNVPLATPSISESGAGFNASHNCGASLAVGASCLVTTTFAPTAAQSYAGSLSVNWTGVIAQTATLSGTGQTAVLAADVTTQPFGNVNVLSSSSKTFTLTNNGNIAASLAYTALTAPVTQSGTCAATLAAGASCTVVLTYAPTAAMATNGSLTVSATNSSVTLNYSGTGVALPGFSVSSAAVSFGNLAANAIATQTVQITNTGNVSLATPAISATGSGFSQTNTCAATLAIGANCVVTLTFAPTAAQSYSGTLSVNWTGLTSQTTTLSGTGQTAALSADVTTQAFGDVNILSSSSKTFTLTNNGNIAATLGYSAVTAPVTQSGTCATTLAAGASCTVVLTYAPTASVVTNGSLTVSATNTSVTLNYSGTGVALPSFALSTAAVAFGGLAANATATQTVQVSNTGNVLVAAPVVSFAGTGVTQTNTCSSALVVGGTCSVTLTFAPTTAQLYGGTLSVAVSSLSTQMTSVSGTGQSAVLAVDSASQAFGAVSIGSSMAKTFTVANNGNVPATLAIDAVSAPVVKSGTCSSALAAGASCTVILTYSPVDTSSVAGTVNVRATNTAVALSYSGVGAAYPGFTLSGTSMNFGNLAANATAQQTITVYNAGNVPLATPSISESGAGFSASHNCGASLAVGASCLVTTTFAPTAAQSYSGSLSVSWAGVIAQAATLLGTGQTAVLAADVTTQAFGSVNILSSASKTFTLTNNGNIAATLGYSAVSAPVTQSGTCAATLAAGASCTVVLTYAPTTTATTNGTLTISATNTSVTLNYSGTGVTNPSFSLSSAAVAFGNLAANATTTQTVQVTNTGNVSLSTPAISETGTGFSQTNTCAATLAVGANCVITLTFTPTAAQSYSGTLSVNYSGLTAKTASLSGTGQTFTVDYVVVGGGGGGGVTNVNSNGGGGGQVLASAISSASVLNGTAYVVTVGAGGAANAAGSASAFSSFNTAAGGNPNGGSSGSGYSGGIANTWSGSGGGGACAAGANSSGYKGTAGSGGAGCQWSLNGVYYGGGGGGAQYSGGGGTAYVAPSGAGSYGGAYYGNTCFNGPANSGGGASGTSGNYTSSFGCAGGSGVVIISYLGPVQKANGGTVTTSGGRVWHTFTSSGTFTPTSF